MLSFYPGPSEIYPQIPTFIEEAYQKGVLSINHRSSEFIEISKNTIQTLKSKLDIPEDYTAFYVSSATESWEIITQSLIKKGSFHIYNGAFGQKWFEYTQKIKGKNIKGLEFGLEDVLEMSQLEGKIGEEGLICLTHNETSNGTILPKNIFKNLKERFPEKLIAIDATSSFAGVKIPFENIDICFASVQKCLGLPAGMGLMICSPQAIQQALEIGENEHYNSLCFMIEKMKDWQTTYTPNILSVFLLMKIADMIPRIDKVEQRILAQANMYQEFFEDINHVDFLIKNEIVRSPTVLTFEAEVDFIQKIKRQAEMQGMTLGNGYGKWKNTTFRIANFPAIRAKSIEKLMSFFLKLT